MRWSGWETFSHDLLGLVTQLGERFLLRVGQYGIAREFFQIRKDLWELMIQDRAFDRRNGSLDIRVAVTKVGVEPGPIDADAIAVLTCRLWLGFFACRYGEQKRECDS